MEPTEAEVLDGNMLAGLLADVFVAEVTTAQAKCAGCGHVWAVAQLSVYGPFPGLVARCPGCTDVMLRMVDAPGGITVDLRGVSYLRLPRPAESVDD